MKRLLKNFTLLILIFTFTTAFSGCGQSEEAPAISTPPPAEQPAKTVYADVSGQVFDDEEFLMCGIIINNTTTKKSNFIYTNKVGRFSVKLEKGSYELTFFKDVQYEIKTIRLEIKNQLPIFYNKLNLEKLYELNEYKSVDLHQHTIHSDGSNTPSDLSIFNQAMGLDFSFLTDHNSVDGKKEFLSQSNANFTAGIGIEVSSADKGHFNVINTDKTYNYNFNSAAEMVAAVNEAKNANTFVQINHPSRVDILGLAYWDIIENFEGMEIWNGKDAIPMLNTNLTAKQKWYELLNKGIFLPATAGSDNHNLFTQNNKIPKTYVKTDSNSIDDLISALKLGKAFISNGPYIKADIDNKSYGESVSAGIHTLNFSVYANENITKIRIIKNGNVVTELTDSQLRFDSSIEIKLILNDYITIETETVNNGYALTNPIFCK